MNNLIKQVKQAGVVGAGGAGFPTYIKYSQPVEYFIVNGAECEPLLSVDKLIIENYADKLVYAIEQIAAAIQAKKTFFAIKAKYHQARQALEHLLRKKKNIQLFLLEDLYPAGDEQILVYDILNRIVPEGGIPLNIGAVVSNVETILNVFYALDNKPVTHTYVSIAGDVTQPVTAYLPIGLPIRQALSLAGNHFSEATHIILDGGPMMGKLVEDWDEPIVKTTKGLIVIPRHHPLTLRYINPIREVGKNIASICCACLQCTELCPRYLIGHSIEPHKVMIAWAQRRDLDDPAFNMAHFCCECGICELFACFMDLAPRQLNAKIKKDLLKAGRRPKPRKTSFAQHPQRKDRLLPTNRVKARLRLTEFDRETSFITTPELKIKELRIKLLQHVGQPARPVVKKGDRVNKGDIIARAPAKGPSAPIHSPLPGQIKKITSEEIIISIR